MLTRSLLRPGLLPALVLAALPARAGTPPPGFVETQLVVNSFGSGVSSPVAIAYEPGSDDLWVAEKGSNGSQTARVRVRDAVSGAVSTALTLDCVDASGERGLLGLAFDPDYLAAGGAERWVYLYYTRLITAAGTCALAGQPQGTIIRVSRFLESGGALSGEDVVLDGPHLFGATNHNAGALDFGTDGTLFIATGDNDTDGNANPLSRDLGDLRGKLLRVHRDGTIPADNPFVGQPGVREEIWAYGLRNPFRFRVDPDSEAPIIGDVGERDWEAIYFGVAGADYGYPCFEGSAPFRTCTPAPPAGSVTDPLFEYGHGAETPPVSGNSVTGGPVYHATAFPEEYHGNYFFGDYVDGWIRRGRLTGDGRLVDVEMFMPDAGTVVDLLVSPSGCLTWVGVGGFGVRDVCYVGGTNGQPQAVSSATPLSGLAPLTVQFDGSASSDPDLDPLTFSWDFDEGPGSAAEMPSHQYGTNGVYHAVLTVDDQQGEANSVDAAAPLRVVVGNRAPAAAITSPPDGTLYSAGDTISFAGGATDPEDGVLAASRLAWTVVFHHGGHTHPFLGPIGGVAAGGFTIPTTGEDATDVFYRIHLSATDSGDPLGPAAEIFSSTSVDVVPIVSQVTLAASPAGAGLVLEFDQQAAVAPAAWSSVAGFPRTVGAPSPQTTGSGTFFFQSWSDAGAAEHQIATPAANATLTATFSSCAAAMDHRTVSGEDISDPQLRQACLTITAGPALDVLTGGVLTLRGAVSVALANGFSIAAGGELVVDLAPPI